MISDSKINETKADALLGGGRVWLERRSPLLLPFEVPSQGTSPSRLTGRRFGFAVDIPGNPYPREIHLGNGTHLRLCHVNSKRSQIYCSEQAQFYHMHSGVLTEIKPTRYNPDGNITYSGGRIFYLSIRQCSPHKTCHVLVFEAWVGVRHRGMQIDHINGVTTDNRASNLQEVTPEENQKRAVILRARRMIARDDRRPELLPENMKPEELLALFNKYNVAGDCYEGE